MKSMSGVFFLIFLSFAAKIALAQDMAFPLVCEPGQSCWIINYPDINGEDGKAQDYTCGPGATDGDSFLRLGLSDVQTISLSPFVLAAQNGVVKDASDGVADRVIASRAQLPTGTANCGNGIVIDHGMGLQTAYCHLRKGSLKVKKGDRVVKGQVIATAGQSGLASWPQLGFAILKSGYMVDPVTGNTTQEGCGFKERPVIALPPLFMSYQPAAIVTMGFSIDPVTREQMAIGKAPRFAVMNREERTINLWAMALGIHTGDEVEIRIRDPRGRTFQNQTFVADADYERLPINVSRARGYVGWRQGTYVGEVKVTRTVANRPVSVTRQVTMIVE